MKRRTLIFLVGMVSFFSLSAFVKVSDPFLDLLKKLDAYTKNYPTEKVYLHLDKPYYAIGDDIWFKAYVTDGRNAEPSNISNVLYVELIDENDLVKRRVKLGMKSGVTWGDFKLTDSLLEGNYRIRAYTQWMQNAGSQFFFDKRIKIGNSWATQIFTKTTYQIATGLNTQKINSNIKFTNKNGIPLNKTIVDYEVILNKKSAKKGNIETNETGEINIPISDIDPNTFKSGMIITSILLPGGQKVVKNIPITSVSAVLSIQFFPEGGTLVENLPSKIGIKAINTNGRGENIVGKIVDNDGVEVLNFETTYLGMGSFTLTPLSGKTYVAKISQPDGTLQTIDLPRAEKSGYVMAVNNLDSLKMGVKVMISEDKINKGELNLIAHQNGRVHFTSKIDQNKQIASISFSKTEIPSGLITLTLFGSDQLPVAERIAFVNNPNNRIDINTDEIKTSTSKRENIKVNFKALNKDIPLQGSFSVAVTNSTVVEPDLERESHIFTSLLLNSDLVGYIEKPNYYFLNDNLKTRTELDHLLLTQGWRKIDWKRIHNETPQVNSFTAEKSLEISGLVTANQKPVPHTKVTLLSSSNGLVSIDTLTDANGKFKFDQLQFGETTTFVLQAKDNKNKKAFDIKLDNSTLPFSVVNLNGDIEVNVNETIKSYLAKSDDYFNELTKQGILSQTNNLKTVEIKGEKANKAPNSLNRNGPGNASVVITADDLKNSFSLPQYLQRVVIRGGLKNAVVYLDGFRSDRRLEDIPPSDVESLEVLNGIGQTFLYGNLTEQPQCVLVITTKTGGSMNGNNLKQVEIVAEKPNKAPNSVNLNGAGKADAIFDAEDLKTVFSLNEYFVGRVTGLIFLNGSYYLSKNDPRRVPNALPMRVYLNGTLLQTQEEMYDIPVTDIESVEILKSVATTFAYGTIDGVILITTKTASTKPGSTTSAPGFLTINPIGYYANRQFYSPQYATTPDPKPDLRTTVYWNPHVVTDKEGKANINFFNTDQAGDYRVVIEGIDAMGNLARKVFNYQVK